MHLIFTPYLVNFQSRITRNSLLLLCIRSIELTKSKHKAERIRMTIYFLPNPMLKIQTQLFQIVTEVKNPVCIFYEFVICGLSYFSRMIIHHQHTIKRVTSFIYCFVWLWLSINYKVSFTL